MRTQYKNKTVIVTGASGGIGTEICKKFGENGAYIVAIDVSKEGLMGLSVVLKQMNILHRTLLLDITDKEAVKKAMNTIANENKSIDVLVNNAGITHLGIFGPKVLDPLVKVLGVNVVGAANCTAFAIEALKKSKGMIVGISSVAGFAPLLTRSVYACSKHAMFGLFDTIRAELASSGVGVLMVAPSFVNTGIRKAQTHNNNAFTTGNILEPSAVAKALYHGCLKRKRQIIVGTTGKKAYWLNKLFPRIFDSIMKKKLNQK